MREAESNHNKFEDSRPDYRSRGDGDRPPRGGGYRGRGGDRDDREPRGRGGRGRGGFGVNLSLIPGRKKFPRNRLEWQIR